jgi:ferritin-like metal-binding protein YciE
MTKALPKLAKAAASSSLREAFLNHLEETEEHVRRVEAIFKQLDKPARGKKCLAMEGLIKEGGELLAERKDADAAVLDAGLICAAQKVEHYEIAAYGTLATWAEMLGYLDATPLLEKTLSEEKTADETLTRVAAEVNVLAESTAE